MLREREKEGVLACVCFVRYPSISRPIMPLYFCRVAMVKHFLIPGSDGERV